jgi:hypothetical protein
MGRPCVEHVRGMPIVLDLRDAHIDHGMVDAMFDWLRWVDATFSSTRTVASSAG